MGNEKADEILLELLKTQIIGKEDVSKRLAMEDNIGKSAPHTCTRYYVALAWVGGGSHVTAKRFHWSASLAALSHVEDGC